MEDSSEMENKLIGNIKSNRKKADFPKRKIGFSITLDIVHAWSCGTFIIYRP